jgi:hypothetical protein
MAQAKLPTSTASGASPRIQAALTQIATGKNLTAAPYSLTAAQAQTVGVACLTAVLATDKSLRDALVHVLLGK